MGVSIQHDTPATLPPGKTWNPLYRRLGGPQGQCGQVWKVLPSLGLDPRTVQPIASRYTDYAVPTHLCSEVIIFFVWLFSWGSFMIPTADLKFPFIFEWYPNFIR
jgi:hypothetical protein